MSLTHLALKNTGPLAVGLLASWYGLTACTVEPPAAPSGAQGSGATGGGATGAGGSGVGGSMGGAGGTGIVTDPTRPIGDVVGEICAEAQGELKVGRTLLRRMTRKQFDNTTRDLLGSTGDPASAISPDERVGPFTSNARTPITNLVVEQHSEVAARVATDAATRMASIAPCDLSQGDAACTTQFVTEFGAKAFRRPLSETEVASYVNLYNLGSAQAGAELGFRTVVETMLQSPVFLYHADAGTAGTPSTTPVPTTAYELASRLAYFLWNTMPDPQLFQQAESGALLDLTVLETEVGRMLADPRAQDAIPEFHLQWLGINEMTEVQKDTTLYPSFGTPLVDAMRNETGRFADYVIRSGDGLLSTLFNSTTTFPEGDLFGVYGLPEPAGYVVGTPVELNPAERSGLLTRAAFLATHAHRDQSSPVHRGLMIRENVLCQPIDSPPANVNNVPPQPTPSTSTRERFAQHSANVICAGCHNLMDPIGLGFEHYDALGAYRTMDGLGPVDATGELIQTPEDLIGPYNGAIELSQRLSESPHVQACLANQWFRFALGRIESNDDACALKAIYDGFTASGGNVRQLLVQIALSDAFRHVRGAGG